MAFERERAQIQRRAVVQNRPFAHSGRFCGHKSTKETVKTIACGDAGRFRCTRCCSCASLTLPSAHETAGALGTRHSPRPLWAEDKSIASGASRFCPGMTSVDISTPDTHSCALAAQCARGVDESSAQRGRGERRMPVAPAASCALGIGRTHTSNNEYPGITRRSRTQWF